MNEKVGRNDPCPCGSGKKYKQCCIKFPGAKRKIKAKLLSGGQSTGQTKAPDLLERTFGNAIASANAEGAPPKPIEIKKKADQADDKGQSGK